MSLDQRSGPLRYAGQPSAVSRDSTNLADLLERILDKGIVIAGDISISLVDVELLTIKVRLLIASVDKAQEIGVNWWQADPWLSSRAADQRAQAEPGPDSPQLDGDGSRRSGRNGARGRSGEDRLGRGDPTATDQRALVDRLERLEAAIDRLAASSGGGGAHDGRGGESSR